MIVSSDKNYFVSKLEDLKCEYQTRSYIIGIFNKYLKNADGDLSRDNIILLYADASANRNFICFQNIGDWVFFCRIFFPEFIPGQMYVNLGQMSYFHCYKILERKWPVFEELADRFESLENQTKKLIRDS